MTLYVMLIWVGVAGNLHSGAAATIQGFASEQACEKATDAVKSFYDGVFYRATVKCVALETRNPT